MIQKKQLILNQHFITKEKAQSLLAFKSVIYKYTKIHKNTFKKVYPIRDHWKLKELNDQIRVQ